MSSVAWRLRGEELTEFQGVKRCARHGACSAVVGFFALLKRQSVEPSRRASLLKE